MSRCHVCFRRCEIAEGGTGFCGARVCRDGQVQPGNYGRITALALDPIEKKPLMRFHSGELILSVGSYGCNLRCPFCQNHGISWSREAFAMAGTAPELSPAQLADLALQYRDQGNAGLAFTYNEPMIGWEFIRDTGRLIHENGMVNVLVTNGTAGLDTLEEVLPLVDAMNIDLKGFTDRYYEEVLGGDRRMVMEFIERAAADAHVEITTLIVPGENDDPEEIDQLARWVAGIDPDIPLHLTRFFPQFHMRDRGPTDVEHIRELAQIAREHLRYVYMGNC